MTHILHSDGLLKIGHRERLITEVLKEIRFLEILYGSD